MPLEELPQDYAEARTLFRRSWAAYVAGAFVVLKREKGVVFRDGARMGIQSTVPEGKGVASSAALEVATMRAIDAAYELSLAPIEVALLSQKVENAVVGAPCGVMDQMTAVFGEKDRLLALLCQPAEIQANVEIPSELAFWGIDSGIAHQVTGADYGSVRVGAFMGYRMLKRRRDRLGAASRT
jgi:L-arabinokinase